MPVVTISLTSEKYAPWGLLTEEERPQPIIWLTKYQPTGSVPSELLGDRDIQRIQAGIHHGEITATGINEIENIEVLRHQPVAVPVPVASSPNCSSGDLMAQVTDVMRKDKERSDALKARIFSGYPSIEDLLALPAQKLRPKLKEMAKGRAPVTFFQECRRKEELGRDRKTILLLLLDIIQSKVNAVNADSTPGADGQTRLASAYYDMIEEFPGDDDDAERNDSAQEDADEEEVD